MTKVSPTPIAAEIVELACTVAASFDNFEHRLGPGRRAGNGLTRLYRLKLDTIVKARLGNAVEIERVVAPSIRYAFDYFIPSEATAVEIALSLRNSLSEFERDVFKAILARESGLPVQRLFLVGKQGACKRLSEPGPRAILSHAARRFGIHAEVWDISACPQAIYRPSNTVTPSADTSSAKRK